MSEININELKFTNLIISLLKMIYEDNLEETKKIVATLNKDYPNNDLFYFRDLLVDQTKEFYNKSYLYLIDNLLCYQNTNGAVIDPKFQGYFNYLLHNGETEEVNSSSLVEGLKNNTYSLEKISGATLDNFIAYLIRYGNKELVYEIQTLIKTLLKEKGEI